MTPSDPAKATTPRFRVSLRMNASRNMTLGLVGALILCAAIVSADVVGFGTADQFRKVVVVGSEYMQITALERVLSGGKMTNSVIVMAFANPDDARLFIAGKGHTDVTYADWAAMYRATRHRQQFRMMRLIKVADDIVVQIADGGHVSRMVLRGADPTRFPAGGKACELLDLYWYRLPRPIRRDGVNPLNADAYIRTDSLPSNHEAMLITRELQKRLKHPDVMVQLRTDTWFIEDSRFPVWFPFSHDPPPDFRAYRSRGEIFCRASASEVVCHGGATG
jgi:hypothetical protein